MRMNQVTLPVSNMKEAVHFYLTLGFTQIVNSPDYARFSCPEGNATFSLSKQEGEFENRTTIYFEHENLDELYQSLIEKGLMFEQKPTAQRYLWKEAILKDPSGNVVKLYWAGENRLNPPWKVDIKYD